MQLIESILGTKNNVRVLRYLARHRDWEFNITELSNELGMNKGILSRLIKILERENIIKTNRKGKIILFKINNENLIIKNLIIPFFINEENFFDSYIKPRIMKIKSTDAISIILYGSYAKNSFKLTSDIDLMIIIKNKKEKIIKKSEEIKERFLKEDILLRTDILTLNEFKRLYKHGEPLIISIVKNHKIITGKKINELIE